MAIPLYLAMTAAEFSSCGQPPEKLAWLSCRFSPGGRGLSNLPSVLPAGSLLILDDQTPPAGHDIALIRQQLVEAIEANRCNALLLDFQRPDDPEAAEIVEELLSMPCPVCVSHLYAKPLSCPVFLPPCSLTTPLQEHLAPWNGHEIWLEAATDSAVITVTETGTKASPLPCSGNFPHKDESLHCRYRIETSPDEVRFHLHRNQEDLTALLQDAEKLGVTRGVGLYQELWA